MWIHVKSFILCREEVDPRKAKGVKFMQMEVTNIVSVVDLRNRGRSMS